MKEISDGNYEIIKAAIYKLWEQEGRPELFEFTIHDIEPLLSKVMNLRQNIHATRLRMQRDGLITLEMSKKPGSGRRLIVLRFPDGVPGMHIVMDKAKPIRTPDKDPFDGVVFEDADVPPEPRMYFPTPDRQRYLGAGASSLVTTARVYK